MIVTGVGSITVDVEIVKAIEESPGSRVTVFGSTTEGLLLLRVMVVLLATGPEKTTLPVELLPPVTADGFTNRRLKVAGVMVRGAVFVTELRLALIVADVVLVTLRASTLNVAVLAPEATVTRLGRETSALEPVRLTRIPSAGAGPLNVTVPTL